MLRIKTLVLLALTSTASLAYGQTGPSGPVSPAPAPPGPSANVPANTLGAERLANYLRGQGHTVEVKTFQNGGVSLVCKLQKDGWRFDVDIEYTPNQKMMAFVAPLGQVNPNPSAAQLLALMKASSKMYPTYFVYRENDHRVVLIDPLYSAVNWSEQGFQKALDGFLKNIRDTYPLWDATQFAQGGSVPAPSPSPTPSPSPSPSPSPAPQPAVGPMGNATYVGSETLGSYGKLQFEFSGADTVVMVDRDGRTNGKYTMQGSTVTVRFTYSDGGSVIYTGTLNGNTINGTATNGKANWQFTVSK